MSELIHRKLACGIEFGAVPLPNRHVVSFQIMVLAGAATDPEEKLGLSRLLEQTLDKGTASYSGQQLLDEFDAIGASHSSGAGLETATFSCTVLPEHFKRAVELHAEILRNATLPKDAFDVNVQLSLQELEALQDDPQSLMDKLISPQSFGPTLGRHPLGEAETISRIDHKDLDSHHKRYYACGRMLTAVSGAIDSAEASEIFEEAFFGFGHAERDGDRAYDAEFSPGMVHHDKDLEQEHMCLCWPGVEVTHEHYPVQQVLLGVLSGGMSGRLFTEVREKQGLVYWVSAWKETPRGVGRLYLGASTTPERCDQTYRTLLREVDRLAEDLEQEELDRAVTGLVAHTETRGDSTGSRGREMLNNLFHYGYPVPIEEKIRRVQAVTIDDIREYLEAYPRDKLRVMTLGPKALSCD